MKNSERRDIILDCIRLFFVSLETDYILQDSSARDSDFDKKVMHIQRSMEYRYSVGEWRIGEPKSKAGYRDMPLTEEEKVKEVERIEKALKIV